MKQRLAVKKNLGKAVKDNRIRTITLSLLSKTGIIRHQLDELNKVISQKELTYETSNENQMSFK